MVSLCPCGFLWLIQRRAFAGIGEQALRWLFVSLCRPCDDALVSCPGCSLSVAKRQLGSVPTIALNVTSW